MSSVTSMDRLEMKRRAVAFYNENNVPKHIEKLLNEMFLDDPPDINGYMSEYFATLAKDPVISEISTHCHFSPSGFTSLKADIMCIVNGTEKHVCDFESLIDDRPTKEVVQVQSAGVKTPAAKTKGKPAARKDTAASNVPAVPSPLPVQPPQTVAFNFKRFHDIVENSIGPLLKGITLINNQHGIDRTLSNICASLVQRYSDEIAMLPSEESIGVQGSDEIKTIITEASTVITNQSSVLSDLSDVGSIVAPIKSTADTSVRVEGYKTEVEAASFFLSSMISHAAAQLKKSPLYEYLYSAFNEPCDSYQLPLPAICFFSCGLDSPGKCNSLKELFVLPKPNTNLTEDTATIMRLYKEIEKGLSQKLGSSGMVRNDCGAFTPAFERAELALEMIAQTCQDLLIEMNDSFDFIVNVAASSIFDEDKKRYEVCQGVPKTGAEMVSMYEGWVELYPIVAIVDGLSKKDTENSLLQTKLGHKCLIIGDPPKDASVATISTDINEKIYSGYVCQFDKNISTVSEKFESIKQLNDLASATLVAGSNLDCANSTFPIDMAVAMGAQFVSVGAPFGAERITSLNRLLQIYASLVQTGRLARHPGYRFSEPPSEEEVEESEVPESER